MSEAKQKWGGERFQIAFFWEVQLLREVRYKIYTTELCSERGGANHTMTPPHTLKVCVWGGGGNSPLPPPIPPNEFNVWGQLLHIYQQCRKLSSVGAGKSVTIISRAVNCMEAAKAAASAKLKKRSPQTPRRMNG